MERVAKLGAKNLGEVETSEIGRLKRRVALWRECF